MEQVSICLFTICILLLVLIVAKSIEVDRIGDIRDALEESEDLEKRKEALEKQLREQKEKNLALREEFVELKEKCLRLKEDKDE